MGFSSQEICRREHRRAYPTKTKRILDRLVEMAMKTDDWGNLEESERLEIEREIKSIKALKEQIIRRTD